MKFLREPLVQFLFLGGLIYFAYGLLAPETEEDTSRNIVVNKSKVQWMQASWEKRRNRLPTQEELDGLIAQYVKEKILYNEAVKMGLDKDDGMIRRRLAQKVEFLAKDLVIYTPPTEQDLKKYYDEHQDKYTPDATYTFMQIYFNPDKRGNATLDDANKAKEILNKEKSNIQDFTRFGDNFMVGSSFEATSEFNIGRNFGTGFSQELVKLEPGKWHGTILSGYGVHLVYIKEIVIPPVKPLSQVKDEVLQAWTSERQRKLNEDFYAALKEAYTIVVEDENVSVLDVNQ
jgi:peptidyl-prolyl cis-trans isomerase C